MTIDVNILNVIIVAVILRFVYVIGFIVAKHKYVTGKEAIAKKIKVHAELSDLHHVINGLFSDKFNHGTFLNVIIRKSIHTLQDMEQVVLILNDSKYDASGKNKEVFEFVSNTYSNALQVISVIAQITVELEPLHKKAGFIEGMYDYLEKDCVLNHEKILNAAEKYDPEHAANFMGNISRAGEGVRLLQKRVEAKSFQQLVNGNLPPYRDAGLGRFFL
ncbi:TPA: hypothetical protein I8Y18_003468 [Raoultella ornithinolytica]|nr:hypothetical protein [Raoultella ornithinolytica]